MPPATSGAVPAASHSASARAHLRDLLDPVVAGAGYDLEDVTVSSAGRRSVVRVIVDADGGVDLDAVADISRAISDALDSDAPGGAAFAGPYVLEVTSPGVDRPLTEPRHWRRATGRLVETRVGDSVVTGRIRSADDGGVVLETDDGAQREIPWSELGKGKVQVEFNRGGEE